MKMLNTLVVALSAATLGCGATSDSTTGPASPATPTEQAAEATQAEAGTLLTVDIPNAKIAQGVLTGGQPGAEHYVALAEAGYKTIIDLRPAGESGSEENASRTQAAGITHVTVPIAGSAAITKETVQEFSDALAQAEGPVVVHCGSGNRVGAMFGMKAYWIDGATPEEALAIAQEAGVTGLEAHVKTLLDIAE